MQSIRRAWCPSALVVIGIAVVGCSSPPSPAADAPPGPPDGPPGPIHGCNDGVDNDDDSWVDADDPDCAAPSEVEGWFALAACSDGLDNDRDGVTDRADPACTDALDDSEIDHPGNPACSDGDDDDGDGLADYPIDPGCAGAADANEGDENENHNFIFDVWPDTQLVDLQWVDPLGDVRQVISWNPAQQNFYLHTSTYHVGVNPDHRENYGFQYSTDGGATYTQLAHSQLQYTLVAETAGGFEVSVDPIEATPKFRVVDKIKLHGDTIYWSLEATNLHAGELRLRVPFFLSGFWLGDRTATSTNGVPTQMSALQAFSGGEVIQPNFGNNGAGTSRYPAHIGIVSPVMAYWDAAFTIGMQYLSEVASDGVFGMRPSAYTGGGMYPVFWSFVDDALAPGETRRFVMAYTLAPSGDWQAALDPYRQTFAYRNGSLLPSFCPTGGISYSVTWNSPLYNGVTDTYVPGTDIEDTVGGQPAFLGARGMERMGVWTTAIHTRHITAPDSTCQDGMGAGGASDWCEFNGAIDLIDPNLTAGPDPDRIADFAGLYAPHGVDTYWFARPCTDVIGASITYDPSGTPTVTPGEFHPVVDMRDVVNRDRYIERLRHFTSRGVKGFYFDAAGCPGDIALFNHAQRELGVDFLLIEGFRDRTAILWPQIPFPKTACTYDPGWSTWIDFIAPSATSYGGEVNCVLTNPEFDDFLADGGQAMISAWQFDPGLWQADPARAARLCGWMTDAHANQLARWNLYGSAIPGCAAPVAPPACP